MIENGSLQNDFCCVNAVYVLGLILTVNLQLVH